MSRMKNKITHQELEGFEKNKYTCPDKSPAYLLEDVISADVFDVLVDDGPRALFFGELLLQPCHHLLVVLPQIGLNKERGA